MLYFAVKRSNLIELLLMHKTQNEVSLVEHRINVPLHNEIIKTKSAFDRFVYTAEIFLGFQTE